MYRYKQVIVVRGDLGMSRGKVAVQAAHAAVAAVLKVVESNNDVWKSWLESWVKEGQAKITLRVEGEDELVAIFEKAVKAGLPVSLIRDAGLTELPPGTLTAVAVGPAPSDAVDRITGGLRLL